MVANIIISFRLLVDAYQKLEFFLLIRLLWDVFCVLFDWKYRSFLMNSDS
jgi:hypothetical protein